MAQHHDSKEPPPRLSVLSLTKSQPSGEKLNVLFESATNGLLASSLQKADVSILVLTRATLDALEFCLLNNSTVRTIRLKCGSNARADSKYELILDSKSKRCECSLCRAQGASGGNVDFVADWLLQTRAIQSCALKLQTNHCQFALDHC